MSLSAPFPYFGGKSRIAPVVWQRLGNVASYVEPFCGSAAVLLARPDKHEWWSQVETVNDADGLIANCWRAIQDAPDEVARWADWPVNENDLHARHIWLVNRKDSLQALLEGDPDYYDAKIAGWWLWGMACWIGGGFCSGQGPWQSVDGKLVHLGSDGQGVNRKLVHLGSDGQGVTRKRVHLGNDGQGVNRQLVHLGSDGQGVTRKLVHLGDDGRGVTRKRGEALAQYMADLQDRLRRVRVCSGDWARVCTPVAMRLDTGSVGVFLDPPYSAEAGRNNDLYRVEDASVAHRVREWCLEWGDDPRLRIALCGYEGEHVMPDTWECVAWKAAGGYGSQGENAAAENAHRERIWFSPHCIKPDRCEYQPDLFALAGVEVAS